MQDFEANALTLTGYTMKSLGADLGIVYSGSTEMHKSYTGSFDVRREPEVSGNNYRIVFAEGDEITSSSGSELFSNIYNRDKLLLQNKDLAKLDDSLVLYFDMETTTMSGSLKVLQDLSKYGNNGSCYDGLNLKNFGEGGPIFEKGSGMYFDGVNDFVKVFDNNSLDLNYYYSIITSIKFINSGLYPIYMLIDKMTGSILNGYSLFLTKDYSLALRAYYENNYNHNYSLLKFSDIKDKITIGSVFDNKNSKIFFNEKLIDSYIQSNIAGITSKPLYVGKREGSGYYFNGNIYEVRIYNRALSEKEIKAAYGSTIK